MIVRARHFESGRLVSCEIQGSEIVSLDDVGDCDEIDLWIAPAFWDLQVNGRLGASFADPDLTVDQAREIVMKQAAFGTAKLCPTLITAAPEALAHGVRTIADACRRDDEMNRRVLGIHLEGPWISELDGSRGAHPKKDVRNPDLDEFKRLQEWSENRIVLVTLAPERPGAIEFIRQLKALGIVVALGHTDADKETLAKAVDAGATLSTHLGNGIAATLPRHPNPIWTQAADDRLFASLIADDHHLDSAVLRVLFRAKSADRVILVSDAGPFAGMPPGRYGDWEVEASGKIVVAGTLYLAGANQPLETGIANLIRRAGASPLEAIRTVTRNPARLIGRPEPTLAAGGPADFVLFRLEGENHHGSASFQLVRAVVGGKLREAHRP